ncbi:MAG TPA: hypothetical protein VF469_30120 [Kofleriaceae bacterium]
MPRLGIVSIVVLACLIGRPAYAQFPPITSRDYAIDLYDGVAIGNTDMVGMGGAGAAVVLGTAGVLLNPSAIAVRPTTDHDPWSLDYHLDFLTGKYSSDYDNNGQIASGGASLVTFGVGGRYHDWAAAVTMTDQIAPVVGSSLTAEALRYRLSLATWIPRFDLSVGGGIQTATFELNPASGPSLFSISGTSLIAGATWLPGGESFRIAAAIDGPIDGGQVQADRCDADPALCDGYILPDRVRAPWRLVAGGAYRWAGSAWNQQVVTPYRDEQAVTIAADVVVTGATSSGYGVEAFGMKELQPSGRHTVLGVRGGVEYEWLPGRLRVRGGSYWEPGRFDGVGGRLHATFGTDLRLLQFHLWGPRRGRISITSDVAARYRNVGLSIGFWH